MLEMRRLRIPVMYDLQYDKPLAARAAAPALRDRRARGAARRRLARARSGIGGRGRRGGEARRRRLGRDRAAAFVCEPRARARGRRARARRPRRRGLRHLLGRHPAGDPRVRADEHGRRQRLRRAGGDALHRLADREAQGGRDHGAARDHAVGRRDDEPGGRAEAARLPRRVRPRGRRDRLRPPGAPDRPAERDLLRHGRDDREGRHARGRRAGADERSTRSAAGSTSAAVSSRAAATRSSCLSSTSRRSAPAAARSSAIDEFGVASVGPHSAGAAPGPVCYGRGGDRADARGRAGRARLPQLDAARRRRRLAGRRRRARGARRRRSPTVSACRCSRPPTAC